MQKKFQVVKKIRVNTILIAILAAASVGGAFKGFVKSVFSLFSLALAATIAFFTASWLAQIFVEAGFIEQPISNWVTSILSGLDEGLVSQQFESSEQMLAFIQETDMPYFVKTILASVIENITFTGNFTVSSLMVPRLYNLFMKVFAFAIILIVVYFLLKILQIYLSKVKIKFLRVTDRALGFIFGLVMGLAIYLIFTAVLICISQFMLSQWLIEKIEQGYVSALFYHKYGDAILNLIG